jgi:DNA polymerase III subunit delta
MDEVKQIVADIKSRNFRPIYFLMGEEPYYIDKVSSFIEKNILEVTEQEFNQTILYGRDTSIGDIVSHAKRYPMMAEYQVVIIKEAQDLSRSIEKLITYVQNPQTSTILVINYKYKKIDKRKALYKALRKKCVVFESKKLYENQVVDWVRRILSPRGYNISPKASQILVEYLGNDLNKINNELGKLTLVVPKDSEITPELIEEHIGISKDYNNFELRKAIGEKNMQKALKIINYFSDNSKDNPMVVTVSLLFSFFSQILHLHGLQDRSPRAIASALKVNPYFVNEYILASQNYPMRKVSQVIATLREFDLKSKGVGSSALPQGELLKELIIRILY